MKTNTKKTLIALFAATALAIPTVFGADFPEDVTGLSATAVDSTSIGLSWDAAEDAEGNMVDHYRIYYADSSIQAVGEGDYTDEIDTPNNNTSYVVTELMPDQDYYFSVTAFDTYGEESESYSYEASATTPAEAGEEAEEESEESDTMSPVVVDVVVPDNTHIEIEFSEPVVLPDLLPEASFSIEEQINPSATLEVMSVEIDEENPAIVVIETSEQTFSVNYIVTVGVTVTDEAGNPIISGSTDSGLFVGSDMIAAGEEVIEETEEVAAEETEAIEETTATEEPVVTTEEDEEDTTPPEDITNFLLSFKEQVETFIIVMNWTASIDSAKDLVDQILYQSMDRGETYDEGLSLGAGSTHYELPNMEGGKEYTFKITTKDDSGNESVGVVKSIRLPQTGLGVGFLLLGSALGAGSVLRKKRK